MTSDDFRRRADAVRSVPLKLVLTRWGGERDPGDRSRWRTAQGALSVTGAKFFNWQRGTGGGGAIDLVMHLSGWNVRLAVQWLEQQFGSVTATALQSSDRPSSARNTPQNSRSSAVRQASRISRKQLRLPKPHRSNLQRVERYLTCDRALDKTLLQPLIDTGKIYADWHGNAVFLMVAGKAQRPVGAELRGTGGCVWRGLAPGTCKDDGYFWIGAGDSRRIVLCESAIDAISCFQWHRTQHHEECIYISTAGVRSGAPWLQPLLARNYEIYCGFDNDEPGNAAGRRMILRFSNIKRLHPPAHDWNDTLLSSR